MSKGFSYGLVSVLVCLLVERYVELPKLRLMTQRFLWASQVGMKTCGLLCVRKSVSFLSALLSCVYDFYANGACMDCL